MWGGVIGERMPPSASHRRWPRIAKVAAWAMALTGVLVAPTHQRSALAGDAGIPPSRQVVILMRALAYDGNLKTRSGGTVNIAILHKKGNAASEAMANAMTKAFSALEATQVSGLPIVVSRLNYAGEDALKKSISSVGIDFIYVCDGLDGELEAIERVTRQSRVMSVGSKPSHVEKGLTIGVFQIDEKCTILLNLTASRQEGVAFAADLLRLSKVIR